MDVTALITMSPEEAKRVLGFPPGARPTVEEVRKAQRQLAFKHHTDTGGDRDTLVEINNAADVLMSDYDRRPTRDDGGGYSGPPARGYGYDTDPTTNWKEPEPVVTTFDEAKAKAGIPSGVDWVFVTDRQRGVGYMSDEFSRSETAWVAYGRTATQHVFVGMKHFTKSDYFVGGGARQDLWTIEAQTYPIRDDEGQQPAWLYGNIVKALKKVDFEGKFNSKVMDARGWTFSEKIPHVPAISLKHLLVETGAVSGDDARVQGRKHVIEVLYHQPYGESPHAYKIEYGKPPHTYTKMEGITLLINGKQYDLDEADTKTFVKTRMGGKYLVDAIYGDYPRDGSRKNITRMRLGKEILKWLTEKLKGLPPAAVQTMLAAAQQ